MMNVLLLKGAACHDTTRHSSRHILLLWLCEQMHDSTEKAETVSYRHAGGGLPSAAWFHTMNTC
jgi:hypothetical protein